MTLAVFALIGILGILDHFSGFEISFAIFYLIPTAFAAWYVGLNVSLVVSLVAAATWLTVDFTAGHIYSQAWIPFWNAFTRVSIFAIVAYLLSTLKGSLATKEMLIRADALTGVRSLRAFEEEAGIMLKSAARHRYPVSFGYIDLDGFKSLNDAKGHAVGDLVLKTTGAQLNSLSRAGDIVARIGGDEFVVLSPHTDRTGAEVFFGRLQAQLLKTMKDKGWNIGFSIGVAVFPDGTEDQRRARSFADELMYTAKKGGKNTVVYGVFPSSDDKGRSD